MEYLQSNIFLADENDEGYGFLCSRHNNIVYTMYWAPNNLCKKTSFHSIDTMYKDAQLFTQSMIKHYTPLHIALCNMFEAFIVWYDKQK